MYKSLSSPRDCELLLRQARRPSLSTKYKVEPAYIIHIIVQELCESRGGRPGLSVLTSLLVSVDVKLY